MKTPNSFFSLLIISTLLFSASSCEKTEGCTDPSAANYDSEADKDDGSCNYCVAGLGGNVTIAAVLQHHGTTIPSTGAYQDTVYLKFNTSDNPGADLSLYDTYFVGHAGEDHIHLEGLKCGNYYIYGVGFDNGISQRVTGGIPYSFTQTTGEIHLNVPVTE
jgi:hypothetical protein